MIYAFIQGVNPVLPTLIVLLLFILSLVIAWWSYSYLVNVIPAKKYLLIALRASTLLILLFLLLNPFITLEDSDNSLPLIAVYADNTQSLSIQRGDFNGMDSYEEQLRSAEQSLNEPFETELFLFDDEVQNSSDLSLTGSTTHLQRVFEHFQENENRYSGAVLLTDGISTMGRNPVFTVQNISKPMVFIPVGDTSDVKDIAISETEFPETIYTYTKSVISFELQQSGFEGEEVAVFVDRNDERIVTESQLFTAEQSSHTFEIEEEFSEPGFYTYDVVVPSLDSEFTDQNNSRSFTLEVQDNKTEILSLAFDVHPDVGSVRRLIASDMQNELTNATVFTNGQVLGQDPLSISNVPDLIVVHGLPEPGSEYSQWLNNSTSPVLYLSTPDTYQNGKSVRNYLSSKPYRATGNGRMINVQIENFLGDADHPILNVPSVNFQRMPFLITNQSAHALNAGASVLFRATFQREVTPYPLLIVNEGLNRRVAVINAYNWYLFEQSPDPDYRQFYTQLFSNIISWTASSPDNDNLTLTPSKETFTESEAITVDARLLNELSEPEPDATIEISVFEINSDEEIISYRMNHDRRGNYKSDLGRLPSGIYRVEGNATKNGREIGADQTSVTVGNSVLEFLNTKRNDALLKQLANISNGLFLGDGDMQKMQSFFREQVDARVSTETNVTQIPVYRYSYWFFIILLLLSAEWILRRNISLP
jgi:hypothetical protein